MSNVNVCIMQEGSLTSPKTLGRKPPVQLEVFELEYITVADLIRDDRATKAAIRTEMNKRGLEVRSIVVAASEADYQMVVYVKGSGTAALTRRKPVKRGGPQGGGIGRGVK